MAGDILLVEYLLERVNWEAIEEALLHAISKANRKYLIPFEEMNHHGYVARITSWAIMSFMETEYDSKSFAFA